MEFKFTKRKIISSLVVSIIIAIWAFLVYRSSWIPGPGPLKQSIIFSIISLILSFIITYLIISLFKKRKL